MALLPVPEQPPVDLSAINLGVIIDGLQDPGNVGTIIRTAWAGALDRIILTSQSADPYQGKVVRSSQGGIFHLRIDRDLEPDYIMEEAQKHRLQILAGDARAEKVYFECDLTSPTLILVGNEGRGLQEKWEKFSIQRVKIPQPGSAESLNVAVSAGILIYEAIRQRMIKGACKS